MGPLRFLVHLLAVRPIVHVILGVGVRHRERLPPSGPAIIVANHNNHIDTLVLMSLFPLNSLGHLFAAGAADYMNGHPVFAWVARNIFNVIPIKRFGWRECGEDPVAPCEKVLARDDILIFYPEGTRGEPECMSPLKKGIAHLAKAYPRVPVVPVYLRGLGRIMPKGAILPVPFLCDACVGEALYWNGGIEQFMAALIERFGDLEREIGPFLTTNLAGIEFWKRASPE
jgi:1-acyl-sn-glycerol-3-phosphate acyltransferase